MATSQGAPTGALAHFPFGQQCRATKRLLSTSGESAQVIDYYAVLGLASTATAEDIKNAHVALALKHHPDLSTVDDGGKRFLAISEAWSVLGKPEQRQAYDLARVRSMGAGSLTVGGDFGNEDHAGISESFNTQKTNFHTAVKANASSNWRDLQDKYKTESWQRMPLSERKLTRVRGVQTMAGTIMPLALSVALVAGVAYSYYSYSLPTTRRRGGL